MLCEGSVVAGRYVLIRQLGRGGMGEVWLARHCNLRVKVALKFLVLPADADGALVGHARDLFRREAQLTAQLCALTPYVVSVHDAGVDASRYFLVMEYVDGRSLGDMLRDGPVTLDVLVRVLEQVAAALDVAHQHGVVHRDVKPGNILVKEGPDGAIGAKLADFGVAAVSGAGLAVDRPLRTSAGGLVGTPEYMSPEQLLDGDLDGRSDVWALGVVAYEALTGISPFRTLSDATLPRIMPEETLAPPSVLVPGLSRAVDRWMEVALDKTLERRFASAGRCARALRACLESPSETDAADVIAASTRTRESSAPVPRSRRGAGHAAAGTLSDAATMPIVRLERMVCRVGGDLDAVGIAGTCRVP